MLPAENKLKCETNIRIGLLQPPLVDTRRKYVIELVRMSFTILSLNTKLFRCPDHATLRT